MKKLLITLPVLILTNLITQSAFAMHAYRDESCKSKKHELYYKGNYPVGGMYGVTLLGQDEEVSAYPSFEPSGTPNSLEDADVIFEEVSSRKISRTKTTSDGCFEHEEWRSKKTIKVTLISEEASQKLGLKQGEKIKFTCDESFDFPVGTDCL